MYWQKKKLRPSDDCVYNAAVASSAIITVFLCLFTFQIRARTKQTDGRTDGQARPVLRLIRTTVGLQRCHVAAERTRHVTWHDVIWSGDGRKEGGRLKRRLKRLAIHWWRGLTNDVLVKPCVGWDGIKAGELEHGIIHHYKLASATVAVRPLIAIGLAAAVTSSLCATMEDTIQYFTQRPFLIRYLYFHTVMSSKIKLCKCYFWITLGNTDRF